MRSNNKRVKMEHEFRKSLRRAKKLKAGNDPFTRLPDQVIASHILSRFTLEEGARYCILSHRWKKLWASSIGSKLIFAPDLLTDERSKLLAQLKAQLKATYFQARTKRSDIKQLYCRLPPRETIYNRIKRLTPGFERWISNVLQAYSLPELVELSVRFPFHFSNSDSIDTWVECALKKGITRLELELFSPDNLQFFRGVKPPRLYKFPKVEKLQGMLANCVGLNLRDVRLKGVVILADVIEFMVAHFPIERLSIEFSVIFKPLNISGESVRLKSLELIKDSIYASPDTLTYLRISASSLTSLKFSGRESWVVLEHVPCLSELSVDRVFCETFLSLGLRYGVYMSGLKRLELAMSEEVVRNSVNYPAHLTTTLNLEELTVEIHGGKNDCFLWPVVVINAAPFLRKFSVKLHAPLSSKLFRLPDDDEPNQNLFESRLIRNAAKQVRYHLRLKTVELHNFSDQPSESELVQHLLPVSSLEQILISPHPQHPSRANVIATWLPPASKAKLIFL